MKHESGNIPQFCQADLRKKEQELGNFLNKKYQIYVYLLFLPVYWSILDLIELCLSHLVLKVQSAKPNFCRFTEIDQLQYI
jgi:hypothetical protein